MSPPSGQQRKAWQALQVANSIFGSEEEASVTADAALVYVRSDSDTAEDRGQEARAKD